VSGQDETLLPAPDGGMAGVLVQLAELGFRMKVLEDLLEEEPDLAGYRPVPAPRWWQLEGEERAAAIGRLASWVREVYVPSYGHLAARLPPCWAEHPLCLHVLDWLAELHCVLYLRRSRSSGTLAGQAEWTIRQLPAAADLMAADTSRCEHSRLRVTGAVR
jgi:hypothetical protein